DELFRNPMKNRFSCNSHDQLLGLSRRGFLERFGMGFGGLALAALAGRRELRGAGALEGVHHPARAKRVIWLFQSGGPSQLDLFDHKPLLNRLHGTELPAEVRMGQRLTGMTGNQSSLPLVGSPFVFRRHGESGAT